MVAVGADLAPSLQLQAYRAKGAGAFPWRKSLTKTLEPLLAFPDEGVKSQAAKLPLPGPIAPQHRVASRRDARFGMIRVSARSSAQKGTE